MLCLVVYRVHAAVGVLWGLAAGLRVEQLELARQPLLQLLRAAQQIAFGLLLARGLQHQRPTREIHLVLLVLLGEPAREVQVVRAALLGVGLLVLRAEIGYEQGAPVVSERRLAPMPLRDAAAAAALRVPRFPFGDCFMLLQTNARDLIGVDRLVKGVIDASCDDRLWGVIIVPAGCDSRNTRPVSLLLVTLGLCSMPVVILGPTARLKVSRCSTSALLIGLGLSFYLLLLFIVGVFGVFGVADKSAVPFRFYFTVGPSLLERLLRSEGGASGWVSVRTPSAPIPCLRTPSAPIPCLIIPRLTTTTTGPIVIYFILSAAACVLSVVLAHLHLGRAWQRMHALARTTYRLWERHLTIQPRLCCRQVNNQRCAHNHESHIAHSDEGSSWNAEVGHIHECIEQERVRENVDQHPRRVHDQLVAARQVALPPLVLLQFKKAVGGCDD